MKPAPVLVPIPAAAPEREPDPVPAPEPDRHCPACGSPSWWRSLDGWRCAYCSPRPAAFTGLALALAGGQWTPGCAPPERPAVTVDDVLARHGQLLVAGTVRTLDVLAEADDDLPDLLDADALAGFAAALVADHRVRPLPPTDLPPLARIAVEIGEDVNDLREYLDRSGPGRALRVRIERDHGAVDRCLLALRSDPDGGLLPLLARALDAETRNARTER